MVINTNTDQWMAMLNRTPPHLRSVPPDEPMAFSPFGSDTLFVGSDKTLDTLENPDVEEVFRVELANSMSAYRELLFGNTPSVRMNASLNGFVKAINLARGKAWHGTKRPDKLVVSTTTFNLLKIDLEVFRLLNSFNVEIEDSLPKGQVWLLYSSDPRDSQCKALIELDLAEDAQHVPSR